MITGKTSVLDIVKICCKARINEMVHGGLSSTPYIKFTGLVAIVKDYNFFQTGSIRYRLEPTITVSVPDNTFLA